jgi:dolichol-phosphate mannosyltransferase
VTQSKPLLALFVAIVALTGWRLWLGGKTELLPEEAYYWTYSQHPALGYFDHPPMVAWSIGIGTRLLGDTERGVRLVNTLLWAGSCLTLLLTARLWFSERVAVCAAWLFVLLPVFMGIGFIATPDGPLVFFWTLTLYALARAVQTERTQYWLLAGVAFGGALTSKYYALLLAPSLFWFLLMSPKYRCWLQRWQPWAALALGLVMFSPVIVWNAQHGWASFAFQASRTVDQNDNAVATVVAFWLIQVAVLTPLGLVLSAVAATRAVKRGWLGRDDAWNFAASFSLPLFLLFVAASFKTDVHVGWTAPAFLSLSLAGAAVFVEGVAAPQPRRRGWWRAGAWVLAVICATAAVFGHLSLSYGRPRLFSYRHAGGWRRLAARVDEARQELTRETGQRPFVVGADKYYIAAEMGFYLKQPDDCVNLLAFGQPGLSYRYWTDLRSFEGRPAVVVMFRQHPRLMERLRAHFNRVVEPDTADNGTLGKRWRDAVLVRGYGYRANTSAEGSP